MYYDILLIIQAPADARYALNIYENNRGKKIHLCIVNVELVYKFIKGLNLENVDIQFIPYLDFDIKNPLSIIKTRFHLKNAWDNYFSDNEYGKIYYFSRFFDWYTAGLIGRFIKNGNSNIIYWDHYDDLCAMSDVLVKKISTTFVKNFIVSIIISFVSNVKFISRYKLCNIEFNYKKYPIKKITEREISINKNFYYSLPFSTSNKNNILFFLSPEELSFITKESIEIVRKLIKNLKDKGYCVIVKGHPRLGVPKDFLCLFDHEIPKHIPSEFLNYSNIDTVIGVISSATSYVAKCENIRTISIINFLKFREEGKFEYYRKFLSSLSDNNVEFISRINEI